MDELKTLKWQDVMSRMNVIAYDQGKSKSTGKRMERFTIDGTVTNEQLKWLCSHSNVKIGSCHYRYAPEIVHPVVYLM